MNAVQYKAYNIRPAKYAVQYRAYIVRCTLYDVQCTAYTVCIYSVYIAFLSRDVLIGGDSGDKTNIMQYSELSCQRQNIRNTMNQRRVACSVKVC